MPHEKTDFLSDLKHRSKKLVGLKLLIHDQDGELVPADQINGVKGAFFRLAMKQYSSDIMKKLVDGLIFGYNCYMMKLSKDGLPYTVIVNWTLKSESSDEEMFLLLYDGALIFGNTE